MRSLVFALICCFSFSTAWAQRWVDIEVTRISPASNFSYEEGGSVPVSLIIKNMGPDVLLTSDSIAIRFIDAQMQMLAFKNGSNYPSAINVKAKKLLVGDTMHIDTTILTSLLMIPRFLNGYICIDAYPCADSISGLWNTNMDTALNNNITCEHIHAFPTSIAPAVNGEYGVSVYPNPATTGLNIYTGKAQGAKVKIRNLQGQVIGAATEQGNGLFTFNTAGLPAGIYFVEMLSNNDRTMTKFIKQ